MKKGKPGQIMRQPRTKTYILQERERILKISLRLLRFRLKCDSFKAGNIRIILRMTVRIIFRLTVKIILNRTRPESADKYQQRKGWGTDEE